ncbi:hypothetical protein XI07_19000 [Bradyrhizobium sp. CCBAU 11445]|uniref:HEPN family nuclease n=1 Tax=unclassified Bradyrhizobium TaxID=2631580 RepID=UPI003FA4B1DE|nr:hypothetical protein [Bradyrhizobium sp. CCBAU 21359]MDA9484055.1 hypothetical protein [Bradyrhizobium sp. CCBAU 11445]
MTRGVIQRSRANLELIEATYASEGQGHVVTQLDQSLLAFIVFPKEKHFYESIAQTTLDDLASLGWPSPAQIVGETDTLGQLLRHLRNAVSHGLIIFHGAGQRAPTLVSLTRYSSSLRIGRLRPAPSIGKSGSMAPT